MSLILNIDTTSATALVNIAAKGAVLYEEVNESQKDHAAFLHPAVQSVFKKAGVGINEIDAVAVSHGPGSYTGIRVGVAAAKGLCYATGKPLITVNQLEILVKDALINTKGNCSVYCPMIDARRLEVFTALYNNNREELMPPSALELNHHSFQDFLDRGKVCFLGNGADKWQLLCTHGNAVFTTILNKGFAFANLSFEKQQQQHFADIAYANPLYIKDFHSTAIAR
jgi:tRNA threonylcarbamoyladenosine biosynthesis protein TsaB